MRREKRGHKNTNDDLLMCAYALENREREREKKRRRHTQKPRNSVRVKQKKKMRRKGEREESDCVYMCMCLKGENLHVCHVCTSVSFLFWLACRR